MNRNGIQLFFSTVLLCLAALIPLSIFAQVEPKPQEKKAPMAPKLPVAGSRGPRIVIADPQTSEKAIATDANVDIKACVAEGKVKVNGWDRNEVRVFVRNGARVTMQVLEKSPSSGKPAWLRIISDFTGQPRVGAISECLAGDVIELDVPMKASLQLTGRVTETTVDSVKKVSLKNIGGNIWLRHITGGIMAETYEGDVTVENSGGQISLQSSTGNIVAYQVSPGEIGDIFKAKTNNGMISLQKLEHRQIEANSVSGSVAFDGKFRPGGIYNFKTTNGAIKLLIPKDSSCKVIASYGFGTFNSALPININYETESPGGKNLIGIIGGGESTVSVTTSSGSIGIARQP